MNGLNIIVFQSCLVERFQTDKELTHGRPRDSLHATTFKHSCHVQEQRWYVLQSSLHVVFRLYRNFPIVLPILIDGKERS